MDPSAPACVFVRPRSAMTAASVNENSMTSNASSAQPSDAATSARRDAVVATRHQPKRPASSLAAEASETFTSVEGRASPVIEPPKVQRQNVLPGDGRGEDRLATRSVERPLDCG